MHARREMGSYPGRRLERNNCGDQCRLVYGAELIHRAAKTHCCWRCRSLCVRMRLYQAFPENVSVSVKLFLAMKLNDGERFPVISESYKRSSSCFAACGNLDAVAGKRVVREGRGQRQVGLCAAPPELHEPLADIRWRIEAPAGFVEGVAGEIPIKSGGFSAAIFGVDRLRLLLPYKICPPRPENLHHLLSSPRSHRLTCSDRIPDSIPASTPFRNSVPLDQVPTNRVSKGWF